MAKISMRTGSLAMGLAVQAKTTELPPGISDTVIIHETMAKEGYSRMTTAAFFTLLPKKSLESLRAVAIQKRPPGKSHGVIRTYLLKNGKPLVHYYWSGFIMGTLLVYLQEKRQIDLMQSDFDELGFLLSQTRGSASFILTSAHKAAFMPKLKVKDYSEPELRAYYEAFNQRTNADAGKAMLDGISLIRTNLFYVAADSIIVLTIG